MYDVRVFIENLPSIYPKLAEYNLLVYYYSINILPICNSRRCISFIQGAAAAAAAVVVTQHIFKYSILTCVCVCVCVTMYTAKQPSSIYSSSEIPVFESNLFYC
jgi:hypothetical protein